MHTFAFIAPHIPQQQQKKKHRPRPDPQLYQLSLHSKVANKHLCTTPHHTYIATQYNMCCVYIKCILNGFLFIFAHHSLCAYVSLFRIRRTAGNKKKKAQNKSGFVLRSVATSAAAKQWQTRI